MQQHNQQQDHPLQGATDVLLEVGAGEAFLEMNDLNQNALD